jgi:transcriptional regulator with XRE-family HTH domain
MVQQAQCGARRTMIAADLLGAPGLRVGGIPEPDGTQPMTAAEFKMVREAWGWTLETIAAYLTVDPRTVRRWEAGTSRVPDGVREGMELLEQHLNALVEDIATQARDAPDVTLEIPAGDVGGLPAACWRAVAYRVAEDVPGLYVTYGSRP